MALAAPPGVYRASWRPAILDGYLLRMLAMPAAAVLGVTLVAFLLEQTLRLINELASNGARLGYLFGLITNLVPYQLGLALPASFFVAMFIVIARLDEESEIDAVLAGGVSFERIVAPLVFVGVLLGIVSILLVGFLQPYSRFGYRAVLNAATQAGWTAQLDPQVFIHAGPDFTISADEVDATGRSLKGVFIRRKSADGETVVTASEGTLGLRPDRKTTDLRLNGGLILSDAARGGIRLLRFGDFTDHEILSGGATLRPRGGDEQELTLPELVTRDGAPRRPDSQTGAAGRTLRRAGAVAGHPLPAPARPAPGPGRQARTPGAGHDRRRGDPGGLPSRGDAVQELRRLGPGRSGPGLGRHLRADGHIRPVAVPVEPPSARRDAHLRPVPSPRGAVRAARQGRADRDAQEGGLEPLGLSDAHHAGAHRRRRRRLDGPSATHRPARAHQRHPRPRRRARDRPLHAPATALPVPGGGALRGAGRRHLHLQPTGPQQRAGGDAHHRPVALPDLPAHPAGGAGGRRARPGGGRSGHPARPAGPGHLVGRQRPRTR